MIEPDVALFVTQHPVWLHSNLETLVEPECDDDDDSDDGDGDGDDDGDDDGDHDGDDDNDSDDYDDAKHENNECNDHQVWFESNLETLVEPGHRNIQSLS